MLSVYTRRHPGPKNASRKMGAVVAAPKRIYSARFYSSMQKQH